MSKVYDVLLKYGKITKSQYDAAKAKTDRKAQLLAEYKGKKSAIKLNEAKAILDELSQ